MARRKEKKQVETLAWITDDEAEFWTSITPNRTREFDARAFKAKKYASDTELPDGQHFTFAHAPKKPLNGISPLVNEYPPAKEENLKEVEEEFVEDNVPLETKDDWHEEIPLESNVYDEQPIENPSNASFFDRLKKELLGQMQYPPSPPVHPSHIHEDYEQIQSEEISHSNHFDDHDDENDDRTVVEKMQSFLDEVTEESFVIAGSLDEEAFVNRRSQRAKSVQAVYADPSRFIHKNSI